MVRHTILNAEINTLGREAAEGKNPLHFNLSNK